jgi:hypothetical protein
MAFTFGPNPVGMLAEMGLGAAIIPAA